MLVKFQQRLVQWARDESGVATVDFVLLSALVIGLAVLVMLPFADAVILFAENLSSRVSESGASE
ncbi:hypothetical protein [Falsigemmobacter intermedius]|uniref:hypothetical protein n=1 Tax=Falsigemmobacter intermedius TaxID=1553448 RepID=UPI003F0E9066